MTNIRLQSNAGTISEINIDTGKYKTILQEDNIIVLNGMDIYCGCILIVKDTETQKYAVNFYPDETTALAGFKRFKQTGSFYKNNAKIEYTFKRI